MNNPVNAEQEINTTEQAINLITINLASALVKTREVTPKQALATAVVFAENVNLLLTTGHNWSEIMEADLSETMIDEEPVEMYDFIHCLVETKFIYRLGANIILGESAMRVLDQVKTSYAPIDATKGVTERRRDYARIKVSPLFKEAVHALEESPFMRSDSMLEIAYDVFGKAYISKPGGDKIGRRRLDTHFIGISDFPRLFFSY